MKKTISNLGKTLVKKDQQKINRGFNSPSCPQGGRPLIACFGGSLKGFCGGGVVLSLGPCL